MKLFIKALVTGTATALLFFIGTGMALADGKGGPGKSGPSNSGGMKSSQGQHTMGKSNFQHMEADHPVIQHK